MLKTEKTTYVVDGCEEPCFVVSNDCGIAVRIATCYHYIGRNTLYVSEIIDGDVNSREEINGDFKTLTALQAERIALNFSAYLYASEAKEREQSDVERVVEYIHDNLEDYELELIRAEVSKGLAEHLSADTFVTAKDKIIELAEEYMEEHDYAYEEDWWMGDALDDLLLEI